LRERDGGEIVLRVTSGGDSFAAIGEQQPDSVEAVETAYADRDEVTTRHLGVRLRWNWR